MGDNQRKETRKERIINLLEKGYKCSQLIQDFGFAERTVTAAVKTYFEEIMSGSEIWKTISKKKQ